MTPVIVLITLFAQVINQASCDDNQPQFLVFPQQFLLPSCFPKPGPPNVPKPPEQPLIPVPQPPLPPCPCSGGPTPRPLPGPPKPACPCCKPPTGALALLLDIVANQMNLPKGSLSKLPLCCAKDVNLPPQLLALTAPLSSVIEKAPSKQLTPAQIKALIGLLKTPQALTQTFNPLQTLPFLPKNPFIPQINIQPPDFPPQIPPHNINFPSPIPNFPQFPSQIPEQLQFQPPCITHRLEQNVHPVVNEVVRNVPVYQNIITQEEEQTIRNVPVFEKTLTNQEEHILRQVPVVRKFTRPVVETRTRHVPVIRKRIRTVVEPYTCHEPILEKYTRPVEEMFITSVPVIQSRSRPVFVKSVCQVPVTEKRLRPVVRSQIAQVPVRHQIVKHFIEHRVKPYVGPCEHCNDPCPHPPCFPFPPTFLNVPGTPSFPYRK